MRGKRSLGDEEKRSINSALQEDSMNHSYRKEIDSSQYLSSGLELTKRSNEDAGSAKEHR